MNAFRLITHANAFGSSATIASASSAESWMWPASGTFNSMTSKVIETAKMPSVGASLRCRGK